MLEFLMSVSPCLVASLAANAGPKMGIANPPKREHPAHVFFQPEKRSNPLAARVSETEIVDRKSL
jgi:hypothetical protein